MMSDIKPEGSQDSVLFFYVCSIVRLSLPQESSTNSLCGRVPVTSVPLISLHWGPSFQYMNFQGGCPQRGDYVQTKVPMCQRTCAWKTLGHGDTDRQTGLTHISSWLLRQERVVSWAMCLSTQAQAPTSGRERSGSRCQHTVDAVSFESLLQEGRERFWKR